ncbi:unnamed protein product [Phytophthora lilii]|uniref:Unnamed protein product n=1 Tax=Phytophthora lilii TaxID=2077276 RepID=A0A9W6WZ08_9STRA|nr:unnamed protein product [Phytophthora lilii]
MYAHQQALAAPTRASIRIPASTDGLSHGEVMVGAPDGLAWLSTVTVFSEEQLDKLLALSGDNSVYNLLQPVVGILDTSDVSVRLDRVKILESQASGTVAAAEITRLTSECNGRLKSIKEESGVRSSALGAEQAHAQEFQASQYQGSSSEVQQLKQKLSRADSFGTKFLTRIIELEDELKLSNANLSRAQADLDTARKCVADLEAQLASAGNFSPGTLMDLLEVSTIVGATGRDFWRFFKLFTMNRSSLLVTAPSSRLGLAIWTAMTAALEPDTDTIGRQLSIDCKFQPATSSDTAQASTSASLAPSSSRKSGSLKSPSSTVDLTRSASSTPKSRQVKSIAVRVSLKGRPSNYKPSKARVMKNSPDRVSDIDAAHAVPDPFTWSSTQLDVQEMTLAGLTYWDAIAEYVPDAYYDLSLKRLLDPALNYVPVAWDDLPSKPAASDDDSDFSLQLLSSSDDDDDDRRTTARLPRLQASSRLELSMQPAGASDHGVQVAQVSSQVPSSLGLQLTVASSRHPSEDPTSPSRMKTMASLRSRVGAAAGVTVNLVNKLEKEVDGYDEEIWFEPGLWVAPKEVCYWIVRDPQLNIPLETQLQDLDGMEPARTQCVLRVSDNAFLNLAPVKLQAQFLSEAEQAKNPIKPDPDYDQAELANVVIR